MYGTSPCCKAILGYRKLFKGLNIHASREIEARQVYIGFEGYEKVNRGKADTSSVPVISSPPLRPTG